MSKLTRKPEKQVMGAHWKQTGYSPLYQLYRRVEDVARALNKRRRNGWVATRPYIEELYDISIQLKVLDRAPQR